MSEMTPIHDEEGHINDPALAEEMAFAEKPHRERAERVRQIGKELIDEIASTEGGDYEPMKKTLSERIAQHPVMDKLDRPGTTIEEKRIRGQIKEEATSTQSTEAEKSDPESWNGPTPISTTEHVVDATASAVDWAEAGARADAYKLENAAIKKRELDRLVDDGAKPSRSPYVPNSPDDY